MTNGTVIPAEKTVQIPVRLLEQLRMATQLQAMRQRVVDPKPSTADIDHANTWVMNSAQALMNEALRQGILL